MKKITVNNGLKSFEVADNDGNVRGVISFNPADFGLIERMEKVTADMTAYARQLTAGEDDSEAAQLAALAEADQKIRGAINELFAADVSEIIFGRTNCLSSVGGELLFVSAINALLGVVRDEIEAEAKKSAANIEKYTKGVI